MDAQFDLKQAAGTAAVDRVQSGMRVGLGTGSTAIHAVREIGRRITNGLLRDISGVPTSRATAEAALDAGIPLVDLDGPLDVTIDGADEIDHGSLDMVKGGGGALLREKIVGAATDLYIAVVDETKVVDRLGSTFRIPVEVARFGVTSTLGHLDTLGRTQLRMTADREYVTDNGNYIVDIDVGVVDDPSGTEAALSAIPGVLENGLFVGVASVALVASDDGVRELRPTIA